MPQRPAVNSRMMGLTALAGAGAAYYGSRLARGLSAIAGAAHGPGAGSDEPASCPPTTEVASTPPNGPDGDEDNDSEFRSASNFSRELRSSDLGIKGYTKELRGTYTLRDGIATMRVDMIRGEINNPLQIVNNMASTARSHGATTLRIEGTIGNPRLYNLLQGRYGLSSNGATDSIIIPLR
jgi:hypothetical protein